MEDYDVLGNFKNLKSIFKNIPTAAPTVQPDLEDSFDDSDILVEFEKTSPKKKTKLGTKVNKAAEKDIETTLADTKHNSAPKAVESIVAETNSNPQQQGAAYRTRRSLRSADENQNNSYTESANETINKTKKSTRGRAKKSSANLAQTAPAALALSNRGGNNTTRSARGRPKRNTAAAVSAATQAIAEVTSGMSTTRAETLAARARRDFAAALAARCPTVDVVDLVTSPIVRVEGFIDLDDDDSPHKPTSVGVAAAKQQSLDLSFDEDNPEMSVKIIWQFKPQMFKLRKYQKFTSVFEQLAERENIGIDQIFLNLNNQIIKPDDTPASVNYKIFEFIEGRAMNADELGGSGAVPKKKRDPKIIKLKIQSNKSKKPFVVELNKTDNFRTLVIKCAEELKVSYENIIKLCFDGENLEYQQTPVDLELEGGELIEIHLKE